MKVLLSAKLTQRHVISYSLSNSVLIDAEPPAVQIDVTVECSMKRKIAPISHGQPSRKKDMQSDKAITATLPGLHEWRGHSLQSVPWTILRGDAQKILAQFEQNTFHCVVTSPPY